jgi:hypothetical protein
MNFYNFGKKHKKTIDIARSLWHNTTVAGTTGEKPETAIYKLGV